MSIEYKTGEYTDRSGKKWYCVAFPKKGHMVCDSEDGKFTVASFNTFTVWGWKRSESAPASALRQGDH